ncbi:hypothetical protein GOP47_0021276 [Adiantum capillus-veneris]|uniref:Uncharacterized protein n=1 Tax=Adiantum capillus-veneris TaxID=13818 RepID=A0A9D4UCL3_ADICA|nr:hypothetical protein GOP47_0021276 [Adiantum capillus-veneris]
MSCLNFDEYMLVGQVLLDEAAYSCSPGFRSLPSHKSTSPKHHNSTSFYPTSSLLNPFTMFCDSLPFYYTDANMPLASSPSPRTMERTLYPIFEADEEGKDSDDDDDEDLSGAFNTPFLRFFKSCFIQFVYMMPVDKALKSPQSSPRKR